MLNSQNPIAAWRTQVHSVKLIFALLRLRFMTNMRFCAMPLQQRVSGVDLAGSRIYESPISASGLDCENLDLSSSLIEKTLLMLALMLFPASIIMRIGYERDMFGDVNVKIVGRTRDLWLGLCKEQQSAIGMMNIASRTSSPTCEERSLFMY